MIVPTPRLLFLALGGSVIILLTGSISAALLAAGTWLVAMVSLAVVDARYAPSSEQLIWERRHENKLSLGAWNPVTLELHNRSSRPVTLQVRDAVPAELTPEGESGAGVCPTAGRWTLPYRVFPIHRGDYAFGPITARYLGPLGLVWRQRSIQFEAGVKVYPNLLDIQRYELVARRGRLQEIGVRRSRRWGAGTEFERLRDYTTDDEFRRINWPATARNHKPIVADYQTERNQTVVVALDAGRLMSTRLPLPETLDRAAKGSGQPLTRLDHAVNATLLLAFVSQQYGDRIGLLAFSDRVTRYLTPRPGRRQFLSLTDALYNLEAAATEADYAEGLGYLATRQNRRSLIVLFTDIAGPEAASTLVAHVAHLARQHLVLVVTLRDPEIERLASLPIRDSPSVYQRAVAREVLDDREETLARFRQVGVLTLDVPAGQLSPALINRYLEIKARTRL